MIEPIKPTEVSRSAPNTKFIINDVIPPPNPKFIISAFGLGLLKPKFYKTYVNDKEEQARTDGNFDTSLNEFGLPVFDKLVLDSISYEYEEKQNGAYVKKTVQRAGIEFATVLIDVSQSKNIVSTPVSGRNGTVKEYISDGDYMVNIKGVLVGQGVNVEPADEINNLIAFCKAPVSIPVASDRLSYFGISSIVVKEYNFSQLEGQKNVVPFELICLSDTPFEISQNAATI